MKFVVNVTQNYILSCTRYENIKMYSTSLLICWDSKLKRWISNFNRIIKIKFNWKLNQRSIFSLNFQNHYKNSFLKSFFSKDPKICYLTVLLIFFWDICRSTGGLVIINGRITQTIEQTLYVCCYDSKDTDKWTMTWLRDNDFWDPNMAKSDPEYWFHKKNYGEL